jgi:hypothetical protein
VTDEPRPAIEAHDRVAEQYVIGAALINRHWAATITPSLAAGAFYRNEHAAIWRAIRHVLDTSDSYDKEIVAQRLADVGDLKLLTGGAAYLHTCLTVAAIPESSPHHARRIAGLANKRAAAQRILRLQQQLTEGEPDDVGQIIEAAASDLAEVADNTAGTRARLVTGGSFLLDVPEIPPAIWGSGRDVLWARGESLVIAGPQGTGKTTIAGQLLRATLGMSKDVFGYPVRPCDQRVLYLAMDRPQQARRCLGRMFTDDERRYLDDCLAFWEGPPFADVAENPQTLLSIAKQADADVVFVDSIKDAAVGISKDEVGAGYNRARQLVTQDGRQIVELHHTKKTNGESQNDIDVIYGSTWITSGAGSVILLVGEPGDPIIGIRHLKKPMDEIPPFKIRHNADTGLAEVWHDEDADVVGLARRCKTTGVTAAEAAICMYRSEVRGDKPSAALQERARRTLKKYVEKGLLVEAPDPSGRKTARWFAAAPASWGERT